MKIKNILEGIVQGEIELQRKNNIIEVSRKDINQYIREVVGGSFKVKKHKTSVIPFCGNNFYSVEKGAPELNLFQKVGYIASVFAVFGVTGCGSDYVFDRTIDNTTPNNNDFAARVTARGNKAIKFSNGAGYTKEIRFAGSKGDMLYIDNVLADGTVEKLEIDKSKGLVAKGSDCMVKLNKHTLFTEENSVASDSLILTFAHSISNENTPKSHNYNKLTWQFKNETGELGAYSIYSGDTINVPIIVSGLQNGEEDILTINIDDPNQIEQMSMKVKIKRLNDEYFSNTIIDTFTFNNVGDIQNIPAPFCETHGSLIVEFLGDTYTYVGPYGNGSFTNKTAFKVGDSYYPVSEDSKVIFSGSNFLNYSQDGDTRFLRHNEDKSPYPRDSTFIKIKTKGNPCNVRYGDTEKINLDLLSDTYFIEHELDDISMKETYLKNGKHLGFYVNGTWGDSVDLLLLNTNGNAYSAHQFNSKQESKTEKDGFTFIKLNENSNKYILFDKTKMVNEDKR